jgi:hypothetical protein
MADLYKDRWVTCGDEEIRVRWYYLWGTKRIPYRAVHGIKRVSLTATRGKARIWGTANPRYWASLDPKRPAKQVALVLDLGRFVRPFLTPDDPDAFERVVRERAHLGEGTGTAARGPFV